MSDLEIKSALNSFLTNMLKDMGNMSEVIVQQTVAMKEMNHGISLINKAINELTDLIETEIIDRVEDDAEDDPYDIRRN